MNSFNRFSTVCFLEHFHVFITCFSYERTVWIDIVNRAVNNPAMLLGIRIHTIEEGFCSLWVLCLFISVSRMKIIVMKNTRQHSSWYLIVIVVFFGTFLPFLRCFSITYIMKDYTFDLY